MINLFFQGIVLGAIQGITEWLPVSSEGLLVLAQVKLFGSTVSVGDLIKVSLFLHMGTFAAALVYFRSEVKKLTIALFKYKKQDIETKNILLFLIISTITTGIFSFLIFGFISEFENYTEAGVKGIIALVALALAVTGVLQLKKQKGTYKTARDLNYKDGILLGAVQSLAVVPGLSRSGLTVAAFLLRKYKDYTSLRLSFLMSLPAVLGGNIALNAQMFTLNSEFLVALVASFVFGIITIHWLLKVARKINFGRFVLAFAAVLLASLFI